MYNSYVENNSTTSWLPRFEKSFLQIYFLLIIVLCTWVSINIIRFPYGMDYGEAPLMDQARRIQQHQVVYKADFNTEPYIIANYPPLYIILVSSINSVIKVPLFQTGRIISSFFSIISAVVIGMFSYRLTNNKLLGATASVIFLGNPYVMIWSSLARVDMMALAFSLLGLYILFVNKDDIGWICIACLCFLASAFTRQTYILAGPLAGFVWLWHLNHRRSIYFLLIMSISTLMIFGTINAITNGGFYNNIVVANINKFEISRTLLMFKQLLIIWPVVLIASACVMFLVLREKISKRQIPHAQQKYGSFMFFGLGVYTFSALITAITVGKVGSDINYFLELMAVCSIWISIGLKLISTQNYPAKWVISGLIMFQLVWVIIGSIPITRTFIINRLENITFYDNLFQQINTSAKEGIVLSDDYLDMVVLSGQSIYYQPFEYGQLYQAGLWDATRFSNQINHQRFPLFVIGGDVVNKECCWVPPLVDALNANYKVDKQSDVILLTPDD